ncbi:RNA exonuclease 4 isoform X2 [Hylaeus anthracinus]|uniref:RNA exonuclease 4 isoform X2 n=1 Tax=Hylaeus volcanicus TaxID=313075 RepID=UPI0023B849D6|nr:RNA exonuclease 4 isoform X2 [Hylaeus volcanicus]XP_054005749.1 RNA exonuclease 4 isoform X2 [Hylaeus anthracinus]
MKRKPKAMEKERRSKKFATNRTMDEKDKKNYNHVVPHTERNASGCNWEIFKNLVFNSPSLEQDIISPENIKRKSVSHQQKSRRKHHMLTANSSSIPLIGEEEINDESKQKLTRQVAMDCEMVGIGDGTESMIARVSIVNRHGFCVYDKYVKPREPVQDYRTEVSGIRPQNLQTGEQFDIVQKEVAEILRGRILVGHALKHDLDVLYLSHPRKHLRDTSRFKIFRQLSKGNTPSLKKLALELLGREIQIGEHSSVEDARAAMHLYVLYRNKWESDFYSKQRMK